MPGAETSGLSWLVNGVGPADENSATTPGSVGSSPRRGPDGEAPGRARREICREGVDDGIRRDEHGHLRLVARTPEAPRPTGS